MCIIYQKVFYPPFQNKYINLNGKIKEKKGFFFILDLTGLYLAYDKGKTRFY